MDFNKYKRTQETNILRIRRTDAATMRMALTKAGDDFSIQVWSRNLPSHIQDKLPADTDRRHAIVEAHFSENDLAAILTEALKDTDVQAAKEAEQDAAQQDYKENYQWLDGKVPVADKENGGSE